VEQGGVPPPDVPENASPSGDDAYRGFLFADLRGYTAFAERRGDRRAADLLDAYRSLVREAVAKHAGAEIKTEGDSFYVVFPTARRAVAAGLDILEAAERFNREHPEGPIRVGIGINAGETVQRGEGFVGSAVNLAARVCAQAAPGQILVTSAVRDAVGRGAGVRFAPRRTRRLKGIGQPIALFAVEAGVEDAGRREVVVSPSRRLVAFGAAVAALAALAVAVNAFMARPDGDGLAASASATASSTQASAGDSANPSPSRDPSAWPTAAERELLLAVGEDIEPHCERADEDDRPVLVVDAQTARDFQITPEERVAAHTGVACEIPGAGAPDTFHLWMTRQIIDFRSVDVPEALIINRVGAENISLGDCSEGSPAYGPWELGDVGGWFLCREVFGDAVIEWSYDGLALYGTALRRDGDLATLLEWWREEARFIGS
jgi:class 3 adenylate cyclase